MFEATHRESGETLPLAVYGEGDERAVEQLSNCMSSGSAVAGALMADHHVGYSQPIGGVVAYEHHISPSGVGVDIACGIRGTRTNLKAADVSDSMAKIMDEIAKRISFGMGRANNEALDHPVLDRIREADFPGQRQLYDLAAKQLGTVGGGNHFVELCEDAEDGSVWIVCHFGSRGFGFKTANGFLALSQGDEFSDRPAQEDSMAPPCLLDTTSDLGQAYISAMELAGEYAYAGRDVVSAKVLEILGAEETRNVHLHHNFAWREHHYGRDVWVIRKGATPAFPGQQGVVGGSMEYGAVVLEGQQTSSDASLSSTVHGAGRVMSRTAAKGKRRNFYVCSAQGCGYEIAGREFKGDATSCPTHGRSGFVKRPKVKGGAVDWGAVRARMRQKGIELRGGEADEAPEVYKNLPDVLAHHSGQIEIRNRLRPLGVAMAGAGQSDPYKD